MDHGWTSGNWVTFLRIGMGLQLLFFCFSMRRNWVSLFESDPSQPVSRDLSEAVLNAHSHFIPRLGWLIQGGAVLGLSEPTVLNITLLLLLSTGFLLVIGLFSRSAAVAAWLSSYQLLQSCQVGESHGSKGTVCPQQPS